MPTTSVVGWGRVSTTTPTTASSAHARVRPRPPAAVNAPTSATESGPRNSNVTASPSPTRATAEYSDTFIAANTQASSTIGGHCRRVNAHSRGRPTASRITHATHWRTATTPTGPSTGKASAPIPAPVWLADALASMSATPVARRLVSMNPA